MQDYMDLDTHEKVHYISESSNASQTSGYSTMSPGGAGRAGLETDLINSPSMSPNSMGLPAEMSNLHLPPVGSSPQYQMQTTATTMAPQYTQLQSVYGGQQQQQQQQYNAGNQQISPMVTIPSGPSGGHIMSGYASGGALFSVAGGVGAGVLSLGPSHARSGNTPPSKQKDLPKLVILEQPVEKFRFRYKSEMHGTHGSLNGANSKRTPKTFPEVELQHFNGKAIIRCSLFQTNLESPHSHQLVVRNDETDVCDPHEVRVSPQEGFVARFQNMGIIHTAKKYIFEELLKKKRARLYFDLGRDELSTKQAQELDKETRREEKDMNLNQVRLCFEAFREEDDHTFTRIAAPVYSHAINNRKSAQTGELRICRLSHSTGSVNGGDDLILLVEKVSKKNIKVRFYEMSEEDGLVWEAYAKFRESDVHHQYAIVCQTPAYRNKDIEQAVEVCVELIRPSDDERSFPPRTFRFKPREAIVTRKRRRTCNSSSSGSHTGSATSSSSSFELPKPVQEQTANLGFGMMMTPATGNANANSNFGGNHHVMGGSRVAGVTNMTIGSQDFNKSEELNKIMGCEFFQTFLASKSEELEPLCINSSLFDELEIDGVHSSVSSTLAAAQAAATPTAGSRKSSPVVDSAATPPNMQVYLQKIFQIFDSTKSLRGSQAKQAVQQLQDAADQVSSIFKDYSERAENNDTLLHEIIANDTSLRSAMLMCHILNFFRLNELLNRVVNVRGESALHCACILDRQYYVRPLLSLGCDPNLTDRQGNTALHVAVREQHQKCIDGILNMAATTAAASCGEKLLATSAGKGSAQGGATTTSTAVVVRINMRLKNDEGLTPLHMAIRQNNGTLAEKLIALDRSAAAQVPQSKDGNTALHMAIQKCCLPLVRAILNGHVAGGEAVKAIIRLPNAAGHNALDLARNTMTSSKSDLLEYLQRMAGEESSSVGVMQWDTAIKEEEVSSSSLTDDEDDLDGLEQQQEERMQLRGDTEVALELVTVKRESSAEPMSPRTTTTAAAAAADTSTINMANDHHRLERLLADGKRFHLLIGRLNVAEHWRKLATLLKMQHLLCLWSNAEDMLVYLRKKATDVPYPAFVEALRTVLGLEMANKLLLP